MSSNNEAWLSSPVKAVDKDAEKKAIDRQNILTKPQGSLGELENIAIKFAAWQGKEIPAIDNVQIMVYAADHGVCAQNVSAFPQIVTSQMVANFAGGNAAISVLARNVDAKLAVTNLGTVYPAAEGEGIHTKIVAPSTKDFTEEPAMTREQCLQALAIGRDSVDECDLFIAGEMGIGNTTSAAALFAAAFDVPGAKVVGPGSGVDSDGVNRKAVAVEKALALHQKEIKDPVDLLARLGGFEIAAMAGAYLGCAQKGIPALVDGFISTVAAIIAHKIQPSVKDWMLFAHQSAEPAHIQMVEALQAKPLLQLGMRLGEGSGAAVAVPLIKTALKLHAEMATFEQASVTKG